MNQTINFLSERKYLSRLGLAFLVVALISGLAAADGVQELNPTPEDLGDATGLIAAGCGLFGGVGTLDPCTIDIDVPAGAEVVTVLIYWQGRDFDSTPVDDPSVLTVEGIPVSGFSTGILDPSGIPGIPVAYRANITGLGLVGPGANQLQISGDPFVDWLHNGAGVVVAYDSGGTPAGSVDVRDGLDSAWLPAPTLERRVTVPQVFNFDSADFSRSASLFIMASEVGDTFDPSRFRSNEIHVTVGGTTIEIENEMQKRDGEVWDTLMAAVDIPAGASSLTLEAVSGSDAPFPPGEGFTSSDPASIFWIAGGFHIPPGGVGRMTGGHNTIKLGGIKVTGGFTLHCDLLLSNNLEINWPGGNKFHQTEHLTADCRDLGDPRPPAAPFNTFIGTGTGRLNGQDGAMIYFTLVDNGEPGKRNDKIALLIEDPAGGIALEVPLQLINGGNFQAHFDQPHKN